MIRTIYEFSNVTLWHGNMDSWGEVEPIGKL